MLHSRDDMNGDFYDPLPKKNKNFQAKRNLTNVRC